MKPFPSRFHLVCALALSALAGNAAPLGTAFIYQGRLQDGAQPATGIYDLQFTIYDALSGGGPVGNSLTNPATGVTNGLFTVPLDFGAAAFEGNARWLAIEVRTNGGGVFVPLNPRQPLSPAPNAIYATKAGTAAAATTATMANTANAVAAGSVGTAGLAAGAVDSSRITDGTVGVTDLSPAVVSNTFWRLGGNRSTAPGSDFLGTADNLALEFKVNGQRALRLEPTATSEPNIIAGHSANLVTSGVGGATIAGGGGASGWQNSVSGGANYSTIAGGRANTVGAQDSTVAGGAQNRATGEKAAIGGGFNNLAGAFASAVGGGFNNQVNSQYSTLGGGIGNAIHNGTATIAGGSYNTNSGSGGAIGGGDNNRTTAASATVPGGQRNLASGSASLAAGQDSTASGTSAVAMGFTNRASGDYSVSLGSRNTASGLASTALGDQNVASGMYSTAFGYFNRATGIYSAALNYNTDAGGFGSHAAGTQAKAIHDGTFVWADHAYLDFASTRSNQFLIRARNGVGIGTNNPQAALHVVGTVIASNFVGSGAGLTTLSGAALTDGSITAAKFAAGAVNHLDAPDGSPTSAVLVNTNGLVGVGTATPQAGLDIRASGTALTPKVLFEVQNGVGAYTNLSWASSVSVAGNLCAIGANGYGDPCSVTLVDISNPQAPVWRSQIVDDLGVFTNTYKVGSVAITSNLLAIPADYDGAVTLVNITDPANPVKIAELRDGVAGWNNLKGASAVAISGNLLAIAAKEDQAVTLADISNPAAPVQRAVISMGTNGITYKPWCRPIALFGNLLAVAGSNAVTLLDVSSPASPVQRARVIQGTGAFTNLAVPISVALSANLLAVSEAGDVVTVVDVSNPSAPVWRALLRDGVDGATLFRSPHGLALSGSRLAIAADLGVTLFDLSQPAQPRMLAQIRQAQAGAHLLLDSVDVAFAGTNLAVASLLPGALTLLGLANENAGLLSDGWVGIGTRHPLAPLHVVGDVVIEGAHRFNAVATHVELGMGSSSYGLFSVALGHVAEAIGHNSVAIGTDAKAEGDFATALGRYSQALASEATALGGGYATGYRSISIGNNVATGWSAVALGESTAATGSNSTAMGYAVRASGDYSTALGSWTTASGRHSTALGLGTTSSGDNATALGDYTTSSGKSSLAAGHRATATNDGTFVWADLVNTPFSSTKTNQFLVRAGGGVGINTNNPQAALHVVGTVRADNFAGSGAGLTVPASQLTGTLSPASIADSSLTSAKIQDGTIAASDVAPNTFWKIGGNSGTGGAAILGTTDNQPLEVRVNGTRALRLEPNGAGLPNLVGGHSLNAIGAGSSASIIGSGYNNDMLTNCYSDVIAGGAGNRIEGGANFSFVGAGGNNWIPQGAQYATIPGGKENRASSYSFAAGYRAKAWHPGSFLWADFTEADFTTTASNQFLIRASGGVGIGAAPEDALLDVEGNMHLNNYDLFLREGMDRNHGLGWYGAGKTFSGYNLDGPVLYGCAGGGLGTMCSTQQLALRWDNTGRLMVDPANANNGSLTPGLTFGLTSGEGIASKRTPGGNQYGLDFYTSFQNRMTILNSGLIGVGTTNPTHLLHLNSASTNTMRLTGTGANGAGAKINFGDAEYVYLHEVSDDILRIQATRLGIGRTPTTNRLEVEGEASKTTASGWAANSDARIKTDIVTVTNALDTLARVRPVSFRYTEDYRAAHLSIEDRPYVNVVAQEFREVFPDAVKSSGEKLADGSDILQVDTYPITIYSAAAIQELNRKVEEQASQLLARDSELRALKEHLADLERRVSALGERK